MLILGTALGVMASSEVDIKFLTKFARNIQQDLPFLSSQLFQILGNLTMLAPLVIKARRLRRLDTTRATESMYLYSKIIWYAKSGLEILETSVIPVVVKYTELKTLCHKIRASYYHLYVLFHNNPPISLKGAQVSTPPGLKSPRNKLDKGKGVDHGSPSDQHRPNSVQPTHPLEGGPVGGNQPSPPELATDFLIKSVDYRQQTFDYFQEACIIADKSLWGSHPLRLSAKVEMCAFLYDCMHDREGSRQLAKRTIAEVYNATEGMDDDTFEDAAELVSILGRMMKRGLGAAGSTPGGSESSRATPAPPMPRMINPI
jgi:hypothetical protein